MDKMELDTLRILERLDSIQASIYDLDKRIEVASAVTDTKLAILPATYVSKEEYKEDKRAIVVTRRWTMGTVVTIIALLVNNIVGFIG